MGKEAAKVAPPRIESCWLPNDTFNKVVYSSNFSEALESNKVTNGIKNMKISIRNCWVRKL